MTITYQGIKKVNKVPFVCFSNSKGEVIRVPVDALTADRFARFLDKIGAPVVAGNVEPEEDEEISDM